MAENRENGFEMNIVPDPPSAGSLHLSFVGSTKSIFFGEEMIAKVSDAFDMVTWLAGEICLLYTFETTLRRQFSSNHI